MYHTCIQGLDVITATLIIEKLQRDGWLHFVKSTKTAPQDSAATSGGRPQRAALSRRNHGTRLATLPSDVRACLARTDLPVALSARRVPSQQPSCRATITERQRDAACNAGG